MSSKKIVITSVFFLMVLSLFANAQSDGFIAKSENNIISSLPCSILSESIKITNTGEMVETYTISKSGSAAKFSKITPGVFILDSGKSTKITNEINIPCDISGEYSVTTNIETNQGLEKEITQIISIDPLNNLFLVPKIDSVETCPCTQGSFKFEIINPGHYTETYLININKYNEYITLSSGEIIINPNKKSEFFVYTLFPCDEFGSYDFSVSVETKNSKLIAKKELSLDILPCYSFEVSLGEPYITYVAPLIEEGTTKDNLFYPKSAKKEFNLHEENTSYDICKDTKTIIPIKIENKAKIANNYYLDINGLKIASLNYDSITLKAEKSSILELTIDPTKKGKDRYELELEIITERGRLKELSSIELNFVDCNIPFISNQEKEIYVNYSNMVTPILLENKGIKDASYILEIEKSDWIKIAPSILKIEGNSSKNFFIQTIPDDNIKKGKHKVELSIISLNDNVTYSELITIRLKGKNIILENLEITKKSIISNLKYIIVSVIIIFIIMVILLFFLKPKNKSEDKKVVERSKVEKIKKEKKVKREPQKIWPYVLALIVVILIFSGIYCGDDIVKSFNYSSEPLYDEPKEIIEELDIVVEPVHEEYISGIFSNIMIYKIYIIIGLILLIFIILLLAYFNSNNKNKKNIKKGVFILLIIIIILVIIFSSIKYLPNIKTFNMSTITGTQFEIPKEEIIKEEAVIIEEKGIKTQIWDEDTTKTLDLTDYFEDPDSDSLFYSSTYDENIDISIDEDGIANFIPNKNWNGNTSVVFIVDDGKGGIIKSNEVFLVVNSVPESIFDNIKEVKESSIKLFDYCYIFCKDYIYYMVFGLIILIVLIFIFKYNKNILEFLDEEEPKKKVKRKK